MPTIDRERMRWLVSQLREHAGGKHDVPEGSAIVQFSATFTLELADMIEELAGVKDAQEVEGN